MIDALHTLHPDGVFEVRAFNVKGSKDSKATWAGYYDDPKQVDLSKVDSATGIYVTLNPVMPDLLYRLTNDIDKHPEHTTKDDEIVCRRWILLDFDPKRPAGISSNESEHERAGHVASQAAQWLIEQGCKEPVIADSGNGAHVLIRVELPNDADATELVRRFILAVKAEFDDDLIDVDKCVHNAARIVRLYGTTVRKGSHSDERPHRQSRLTSIPDTVEVTSRKVLEAIAGEAEPKQMSIQAASCEQSRI